MNLDEYLRRLAEQEAQVIEAACEMALQSGVCGVRVWRWHTESSGGDHVVHVEARPDLGVPYGQLYESAAGERPPGVG